MKATVAVMLTMLFSVCAVFSQNVKIDSLEKVIATTKVDTVKGRSLCRLCLELEHLSDYENAIKKGNEGLAISTMNNDIKGIALCLKNIGNIYDIQGDYNQALNYYQKSLQKFKQLKDQYGIAACLNNIGGIFKNQGINSKALNYYQKSLQKFEQLKDQKAIAVCLGNISIVYFEQSNYPQALNYSQKSLKIHKQLNDSHEVAVVLNNIGRIYFCQNDDSQALSYYQESLKISELIGDQRRISECLDNIGEIFLIQNNYPQALSYRQKSLKIKEQIGDQLGISDGLNNIGAIYLSEGNYPQALSYYQQGLRIKEQIGDTAGISLSNSGIAGVYLKLSQIRLAKIHAYKGLEIAQKINHLYCIFIGAEVSYQADSALSDFKSAFEHHKLFKQYSDSLNNEEKAKEFGRIESKYQFEKEADEAKRKEAELAKIEAEKNQRRDNLQYLTIFAGIIGLFAGLVFLGKFKIPVRVMDVAVFTGLLITFEFLLILFDPLFEQYSGGIPFYKLGFNTVVAFTFAPLHGFLEGKLKKRLVKTES